MIPATVLYVFLGTTLSDISEAATGEVSWKDDKRIIAFVIFGCITAIAAICWVSIVAKRHLKKALDDQKKREETNEKAEPLVI